MTPPTSSVQLLVTIMLMLMASGMEPETCFSRQHQSAIVDMGFVLHQEGTAMDARLVSSERACILSCCSEEVKPDAKCNMVVFNDLKGPGEENCFLFHCNKEQDCPLKKAQSGVNTYDIFKGVIHPTMIRLVTKEQTTTSAPSTPTIQPVTTATTSPAVTTPQATITTTMTTTTTTPATSTTVQPPAATTEAPPILIVPTLPVATTVTTTTTTPTPTTPFTTTTAQSTTTTTPATPTVASIITTRKPNKMSKKQNKTSKKAKIHAVTTTTQKAVTSHVIEMTSRVTAEPPPTTKTATFVTTTTTGTITTMPTTAMSTIPSTTTPATTPSTTTTVMIITSTATPLPTTAVTTLSTTTTVTVVAESYTTWTSPGSSLVITAKGAVQADQTLQKPVSAVDRVAQGKAMAARAAMKSGTVAFMVLALAVLTLALAVGGRKAMESFDRRHYTRLELNDLHYEV
ncbi:MANSC domain-containing protein 1 [Thalassophryne amazonica]|uniref:MANSC domain-containing protein 1 n=1 Tax=Thalassophryne amazonica TaxID=390379 RepID=UPI0014709CCD|nr:MANSC domain-containing protein 1 [Thalassophryne amazonica]XP_034019667.1 MANSC domain-containing protein 1 [Thalassophryne amazonica]